jgi:hypothetical protein
MSKKHEALVVLPSGEVAEIDVAVETGTLETETPAADAARRVLLQLYSAKGELRGTVVLDGYIACELAMYVLTAAKDVGDTGATGLVQVLRHYSSVADAMRDKSRIN